MKMFLQFIFCKKGGCFLTAHTVQHILYSNFPENWGKWRGVFLHAGSFYICVNMVYGIIFQNIMYINIMYYLKSQLCTITDFKVTQNSFTLMSNFQEMCPSQKMRSYNNGNCSNTNLKPFQSFIHELIQRKCGLHLVHAVQKVHSHVRCG
jgi:hypothetical protein